MFFGVSSFLGTSLVKFAGAFLLSGPIPLFPMKLARALAGRPIRALIGVIHLSRGKSVTPWSKAFKFAGMLCHDPQIAF